MDKKLKLLKSLFFRFNALQLLAMIATLLFVVIFFIVRRFAGGEGSGMFAMAIMLVILLFFNGWALMHRNGFDFSTMLFYIFVIVYGTTPGFAVAMLAGFLAFYIGSKTTPVDFLLEKSIIIKSAQFIMILQIVAMIGIASVFGFTLTTFYAFFTIFLLARVPRILILLRWGRAPLFKVLISNGTAIILNYYIGKFLFVKVMNYVLSMAA